MRELEIAESIARDLAVERRARLDARISEIAEERDLDSLEVARLRARAVEAIDRGEFFAEIFVKPTRSINYITLTFTATRTGSSFAEVTN